MQPGERAVELRGSKALDWLFHRTFDNLVYNNVWEDPLVDLAALDLKPHHRLVSISSAACNIISYLSQDVAEINAADMNYAHVSLAELKVTALKNLPDYEDFFRFFGSGNDPANVRNYERYVRDDLSPSARAYWDGFSVRHGRRINIFAKGFYRHGVLGRFIALVQNLARKTGRDISQITKAQDLDTQRELFDKLIAPLFDYRFVRSIARSPISLFALGIPPNQYRGMVDASEGDILSLLKDRIRRLACDFPMQTNYFAWLVFAGGYDLAKRQAVPFYLEPERHPALRARAGRIHLHHKSLTDLLATQAAGSVHRFVLLDAQDWMAPPQIEALWAEINRTANASDSRVIFRTAGNRSPVDALPSAISDSWEYQQGESERLLRADRSSIYGGFHVYRRRAAARAAGWSGDEVEEESPQALQRAVGRG